jgi:hypothetical protein
MSSFSEFFSWWGSGRHREEGDDANGPGHTVITRPPTEVPFDSYSVRYFSRPTEPGGPPGRRYEAEIRCYKAGEQVGAILFLGDDYYSLRDPNQHSPSPVLRFPLSRFNDVITTLRYEKELHLAAGSDGHGWLGTKLEPVGEEESGSEVAPPAE